ncbi:MAG TPA: hypothetical protein VGH34_04885 [Vicinamibacterales bacterium]|jgi:hypothetical protein
MRALIPIVIVALLTGGARPATAADSQVERASLTGLTAMSVVVEDLGPLATKAGLSTEAMQKEVEARLRQAGLSITSDSDAYVYVHVTVADPGGALPIPYVVDVSLMQEVTLPRGVKTRTPLQCPTWSVNRLGLTTTDRLRPLLTERVNEFVDLFVTAYRSVNPK